MYEYDVEQAWYHVEDFDDPDELEELGSRFDAAISTLEDTQLGHLDDLMKYGSMYQNMDMHAVDYTAQMPTQIANVTQAIVDSLVAKQVSNESKATFDVDDGDWEANVRAEMLDKFTFGEFYRCKVYELHEQGFRDAAWAGDGWIKYTARGGKVHAERVFPMEMRLDPTACVSGPPRELYQVRYISKSLACSLYPDVREQILLLPHCAPSIVYPGINTNDHLVRLQEGWHLPDDDRSGGVYAFSCGNIVLEAREWKRPRFPFVRMPYSRDIAGGYSVGIVQQLSPLQRELNKLKIRKLRGLALYGVPRVYHQAGSTLTPDFSRDIGQVYVWTGSKPEVDQSPCVSAELVAEEVHLISQMYQLAGISPLERGSEMPSRMDSRPGMREYIANADEKHALPSQTWNRSFLEAAQCIVDVAREIVEENGSYEAFGAAKDFVTKIDFKDANLEDERFRIKLQNTNLLPTTPTGKRLAILDLLKANAFPNPMDMWEMLAGEHPDVDAIIQRKTSGRKLVEKQMYMIVARQKYFAPDVHQDCEYAKGVALDTVQQIIYKSNGGLDADGNPIGAVNTIIDMLDRYIAACDDINVQKELKNGATPDGPGLTPDPSELPPGGPVPGGPGPAGLLPAPGPGPVG